MMSPRCELILELFAMATAVDAVLLLNISVTPAAFTLKGGLLFAVRRGEKWGGGNIELELLGPDAPTYCRCRPR